MIRTEPENMNTCLKLLYLFSFDLARHCSTLSVLVLPTLQDTLYQSIGSFAVYLLTLSAKVHFNGNSGNKQYLGGESVHVEVFFLTLYRLGLFTTDVMSKIENVMSFTTTWVICLF